MTKVSVIVPNFNHAEFLPDCLTNIAAQTHPPDEVILIDDASTDHSRELMVSFAAGRSGWKLICHESRRGVIAGLNEGLLAATSDWIVFVGADDIPATTLLETLLKQAIAHPAAGLVCGCATIIGGVRNTPVRPILVPSMRPALISPAQTRRLLQHIDNFLLGQSTMYRRTALRDIGGFNADLQGLADSLAARQLAIRHGFVFVPEIVSSWRIHGGNYSIASATNQPAVDQIIGRIDTVLGREPPGAFPDNYRELLARRLLFGGARLILLERVSLAGDRAVRIAALLKLKRSEAEMLHRVLRIGAFGAFLVLVWLTLRLRPFSLAAVAVAPLKHLLLIAKRRQTGSTPNKG